MMKASMGDFTDHVKQCFEDVVVLGHTHQWTNQKFHGRGGDLIYANAG